MNSGAHVDASDESGLRAYVAPSETHWTRGSRMNRGAIKGVVMI
jgi:hypothetical protein